EDPFSKENAAGTTPKEFKRGETFFLTIQGTPKEGYHTYPLTKRTEGQQLLGLSSLTYKGADAFTPLWPVTESEAEFFDEGSEGVSLEYDRPFTWTQELLVRPDAKPGPHLLRAVIRAQVCNASRCTWVDQEIEIPITVSDAPAQTLTPELQKRSKEKPPEPAVVEVPLTVVPKTHPAPKQPDPTENKGGPPSVTDKNDGKQSDAGKPSGDEAKVRKKKDDFRKKSVLNFVLEGVAWGLLSLFTPCVFPMIPITVSFFLKQSENKRTSPLALASVYSGTIVLVLLIGGLTIVSVLQPVSQHPLTNLLLGLLFLFFALSLFGMYEIVLPSGLSNFTSARQGEGGLAGTFFMALTFTIISFACVAPFYGSFLIFSVASAEWA